jgi:DNA repair photolyase
MSEVTPTRPGAWRETIHGRGAGGNPPNRFERSWHELDPEADDPDLAEPGARPGPTTVFLPDASRSIVARNESPDIPFDASINPYRGCEHGCSYCYARPTHEYLGFSAGLDFETKILVKHDAAQLLRAELMTPRWVPTPLNLSGVTDAYQPVERRLRLTRSCLQVLAEFRNPVTIITKNQLVTRDADLLALLASYQASAVFLSITTLDLSLARALEPRASTPAQRLSALETLTNAGIPTGVMVAPIIPGLNDHEIPAILDAAASAGARCAGRVLLRLPLSVAPLFEDWLERHAPGRKDKVLGRLRGMRNGTLNDPRFGDRMRGEGPFSDAIGALFDAGCRQAGLNRARMTLSTDAFQRPCKVGHAQQQLRLFD